MDRHISIKDGKKQYFIGVDDILFALADINYTDIYLTQHTVYKTIRIQIGQLWKLIEEVKPANSHTLARIGRSHIINLKYLQYADPKKKTITLHTTKDVVLEKVPKAAVESLLMLIDKNKRREVLSVYSQRMKLKVSIEDLNDEHLEIDGKVYVDLGLPSGTLWACRIMMPKMQKIVDITHTSTGTRHCVQKIRAGGSRQMNNSMNSLMSVYAFGVLLLTERKEFC